MSSPPLEVFKQKLHEQEAVEDIPVQKGDVRLNSTAASKLFQFKVSKILKLKRSDSLQDPPRLPTPLLLLLVCPPSFFLPPFPCPFCSRLSSPFLHRLVRGFS